MSEDVESEERVIYLMAIFVLAPIVILEVVRPVVFDGGSSLCLLTVVLAAVGLAKSLVRGARQRLLPPARTRRSIARSRKDAARAWF